MKKSVVLLFLICCHVAFSQIGKVYLKNSKFEVGKENTYVYEPPTGVTISNGAKVKIAYHNKFDYANVGALLIKKTNVYEFSLKVPDSTRTLVVAVFDGKNIIDNNQDKGYDVYLKTATPIETAKCIVNKLEFIGYINHFLHLRLNTAQEATLTEYNNLYTKYPQMKEDISYENYLYTKGPLDKEQSKLDILDFAQKCEKRNTEEYWMAAHRLYISLQKDDKVAQMESKIIAKYPLGEFVRDKFIRDFREHPEKTEQYVLDNLALYTTKFKGASEKSKDMFYYSLLNIYLVNGDINKLVQYEKSLVDKAMAAGSYNNFAWELSGQDLITPAKSIDFAEKISKRSLDIFSDLQKQSDFPDDLNGYYNMYGDTYALILYKMNRFEEAFEYQDKVNQQGGLDTGGKERYAAYMEKVKGLEITKKYIETELGNGVDSRVLLSQLEEIYKKSNLPLAEFNIIKEKAISAAKAKNNAALVEKYGGTQAIDFNLVNLEGKQVKLSDYKGKVVVLDFWATWCGPCKASFPGMQELVTKYKGKNVEFLFVNTWERGKENSDTVKKVGTFITDKKYSFNVVFDFDNTITAKYKVEGIPTKILIDKKGTILSDSVSEQSLINLIDEQLSL